MFFAGVVACLVPTRRGASLCSGAHPYETFLARPDGGHPYVLALIPMRHFECLGFFSCLPYESCTLTGWMTMEMWSDVSLGFLSSLAFRFALYPQTR